MAAEKQHRGKCAYHLMYFGHDLYVTHDLQHVFEFDHVERDNKFRAHKRGGGVSRMVGRVDDQTLIDEMAKCELVCCNCHRIKTMAEKDWQNVKLQQSSTQLSLEIK